MTASPHNAFLELFGEELEADADLTSHDPTPGYRLVTGPVDDKFEQRVEEALVAGFELWGPPHLAVHDGALVAAQAVFRPGPT